MSLVIISILAVTVISSSILSVRYVKQTNDSLKSLTEFAKGYFIAEIEGGDTPYSQSLQYIAQTLGHNVTEGVKVGLNTSLGGTMKGLNAEMKQAAMAENPQLALLEGMPKSVKNNKALNFIMTMLANNSFNMGKLAAGGNNGESQVVIKRRD